MVRTFAMACAAWSLLTLTACGGDSSDSKGDAGDDGNDDDDGPVGPSTGAVCDNTLSYDNFGKQFVTSYCTRCHSTSLKDGARNGAPSDHNFDTLAGIKESIEHMDQTAASGPDATNTSMPETPPAPSLDDRKKLGAWLACGAP